MLVISSGLGAGQFLTQLWETSDNADSWTKSSADLPEDFLAQTVDAASNVAAQSRMKTLAGDTGVVIPGHDPDVFRRFPAVASNVVRIAPR